MTDFASPQEAGQDQEETVLSSSPVLYLNLSLPWSPCHTAEAPHVACCGSRDLQAVQTGAR